AGDDVGLVAGADAEDAAEVDAEVDLRVVDAERLAVGAPLEEPGEGRGDAVVGAGGRDEEEQGCQLQPHPPPAGPRPPVAPSRLSKMWSSVATSCSSASKRIVRSARCSFSFGRTAKRPQPASASSRTRLEKDRQPTRDLLGVV